MWLKRTLALLLLPLLLLTGCWSDEPPEEDTTILPTSDVEEPVEEEHTALPAAFSLPYFPDQTLNPYTCADGAQQDLGTLLYEGLYRLDETFTAQPQLCASASYDAAALTWTFQLQPAAAFSDGSPLTAADVVTSWNLAKASPRYAARFSTILSFAGADGGITVRLNRANALLPNLLDIPVIKASTASSLTPLGTGPYALSQDESGPCLLSSPAWWNGATPPAQRIALAPVKDADILLYQFSSHEIQLITSDLTGQSPVSVAGNVMFRDADTAVLQYVGFNTQTPLLQSAAVRQTLSLGINRGKAVSALLSGHAKAAQFPISPVSPLYPKELEQEFSHERFTRALIQTGLSGGQNQILTMLVNEENSFKVALARSVAASLSAGDLTVQVKTLPWEAFQAALRAGDYDLYYGETRLTADWDLRRLAAFGGSLNYRGYSNPGLELQMATFAASGTASAALGLMKAFQEQMPFIPVCFKTASVLVQKDVVDGLNPTAANPFYGLEDWTLHLADDTD